MEVDTIPKLFLKNAREYSDRIALREKDLGIWKEVTWGRYYEHVRNFGLGLKALGFERGDRLAILGDNCREWLYADLAAQAMSGITVGIYPTDVSSQVKYVLENSGAKFVVVKDQEQADKVIEVKNEIPFLKKIIVIDMKGLRKYKDVYLVSFEGVEESGREYADRRPEEFDEMIRSSKATDVGILVYTSGTTADPKGAMISHRNIIGFVDALSRVLPLDSRDSLVSALPLCHIAERIFSLVFPMKFALTINFAESIGTLENDLREISPTLFLSVPRIYEKMHSGIHIKMQDAFFVKRWFYRWFLPVGEKVADLRLKGAHVSLFWRLLYGVAYVALFRALKNKLGLLDARMAISGAAPLSEDIIRFYHSIGIPVRQAYGLTEAMGISFMQDADQINFGAVGTPLPNVQYKIAEDGEILLKGDSVFEGYYNDPSATKKAILDGWLYTGDIGTICEDGQLRITDRKKNIIITAGGKNIAPSLLENKLKFSTFIKEAIVIGDKKKYPTALIQLELENVENWAQKEGITYTTYKSLAINPQINELIAGEVEAVNREFSQAEKIKKFRILDKELDHDDGEITATMKVKRKVIEKAFGYLIDSMY